MVLLGFFLALWPRISLQPIQSGIEGRLFFEALSEKLHYYHHYAILSQERVQVRFYGYHDYIYFSSKSLNDYIALPDGWQLTQSHHFTFKENGQVTAFKSVPFRHDSGDFVYLVFQLGGQFEIR